MSFESVMPSSHLILCHPLCLLPSIFPNIRVFSKELALRIRWPKYWNFSCSTSPSNGIFGLISLRIYWFDFFGVQGTQESFHHHSSKASVLWRSAFFMVQLSHPYITTGKTIALIRGNKKESNCWGNFIPWGNLFLIALPVGLVHMPWLSGCYCCNVWRRGVGAFPHAESLPAFPAHLIALSMVAKVYHLDNTEH